MREIDEERFALKALRGDFGPLGPGPHNRDTQASHALQAARLWTRQGRRIPGGLSGAIVLGVFAVIVWAETRRPLRCQEHDRVQRDVRNLVVAGMSAATLQVLERPLVDLLSRRVEECRWGLLKQVTPPPWLETLLAVALMDWTLYLWHVLVHAAVDGSYLSTVRGPPAELLDLAELQHRQSRLGDAVRSNLRLAF